MSFKKPPFEAVRVKLSVNNALLISEFGVYKGVSMNAEKYISKSGFSVYAVTLITRDDVMHNKAGQSQIVMLRHDEVKEIKPKKTKA